MSSPLDFLVRALNEDEGTQRSAALNFTTTLFSGWMTVTRMFRIDLISIVMMKSMHNGVAPPFGYQPAYQRKSR
ncbi:MAG: hypothetical protein EBT06_14935 [Gammaproteobacteria bacterium]|nr:hypothetical protein [Gammaproteobacteria bacterium]NDE35567.1 hypothetical protein [Gammaproteobacteria bacterium]